MTISLKARTILIIEDDIDIQNFVSRVLDLEGYVVLKTDDGSAGIDIMRGQAIDLVLLDLRLPGRDGWSILEEIRHDAYLSKVPVIVITAIADAFHKKKTLRMGVKIYLIKPLSAHTLANSIARALHQRGKQLALQKA